MSEVITLTLDERQKFLAEVVARRLKFENAVDMLRAYLTGQIAAHISARDQEKILSLLASQDL